MSYSNYLFDVECPECKERNWFCPGEYDIEAGICWKCKHKWIFDPENSFDIEDSDYEKGAKTPNKAYG